MPPRSESTTSTSPSYGAAGEREAREHAFGGEAGDDAGGARRA